MGLQLADVDGKVHEGQPLVRRYVDPQLSTLVMSTMHFIAAATTSTLCSGETAALASVEPPQLSSLCR